MRMGWGTMFINWISISLKWPILTYSPLFEKQHVSHWFEQNLYFTFQKKEEVSAFLHYFISHDFISLYSLLYIIYVYIWCGPHSLTSVFTFSWLLNWVIALGVPGRDCSCRHCWISSFGPPGKTGTIFEKRTPCDDGGRRTDDGRRTTTMALLYVFFFSCFTLKMVFINQYDFVYICVIKKRLRRIFYYLFYDFPPKIMKHHQTFNLFNISVPWQGTLFTF